jgi:hypothetical protein
MESDRLEILNKVKAGEISIEEGAERLKRLESEPAEDFMTAPISGPVLQPASSEDLSDFERKAFQNWWLYPFWLGLGILVFAAGLMSWGYTTGRFFWFFCSWLPLSLGVLVIILSAWSRQARWLHVRVNETSDEKQTRINFSFPIPTGAAGWVLRTFGSAIPQLREKGVMDSVLPLLDTLGSSREPMVVEVNEKDGERVQIYIV